MSTNNKILRSFTILALTGCSDPTNSQAGNSVDTGTSSGTDDNPTGDGDGDDSGDGDSDDSDNGDGDGDGDGEPTTGDGDACNPGELSCECNNGLCLGDLVCVAGICQEAEPDQNNALLRFVHLVSDLGPVDVYLDEDNNALWSALTFTDGVNYVQVPPGNHELHIRLAGEAENILTIEVANLESFIRYSASFYGDADNLSSKVLLNDTIGIEPASVRMQLVQTASNWGQVDLYNLDFNPPGLLLNNFALHSVIELDLPPMIGGLGIDISNDEMVDFEFQIPGYAGGDFYNLYLAQGQVPFMLFHTPDGSTQLVDYQAICGDGYLTPGESCDDGNLLNTDACLNGCVPASCGDGFLWDDEECDDGNNIDNDYCSNTCVRQMKYLFVTSSVHTGNLNGYDGANAICNQRAQEAGLPGTYKAWLSDAGGSPISRMTHSQFPYLRVDGEVVAQDWDDLTDGSSLSVPPNVDEHGNLGPETTACEAFTAIWSNTQSGGYISDASTSCNNWTQGNGGWGHTGTAESTSYWSGQCYGPLCSYTAALLCVEQ